MEDKDIIRSPDTEKKNRVPPGQRLVEDFPVLHFNGIPKFDRKRWTLRIFGLVAKERKVSFDEFMSLPRVKVLSDIHCVTGWSKLNNLWEGVSPNEIRKLVDILPEAKFVMIHSADGYSTNLSFEDFFQPDVVLAVKYNNEPITLEHGYPVRLVVPRLYLWKSAKWVNGIEFMAEDKLGFWESRGYHNHGDPWREERYSR
ncbi:MAG: sulfite oxidase-like oxidoreductase [candidate division WOR-3 bacterium]